MWLRFPSVLGLSPFDISHDPPPKPHSPGALTLGLPGSLLTSPPPTASPSAELSGCCRPGGQGRCSGAASRGRAAGGAAPALAHTWAAAPQGHSAFLPGIVSPGPEPHFELGLVSQETGQGVFSGGYDRQPASASSARIIFFPRIWPFNMLSMRGLSSLVRWDHLNFLFY